MNKSIGIVFSLFFLCVSILCFLEYGTLQDKHVWSPVIFSILYGITIGNKEVQKLLQITITLLCGCFMLNWNDPNSLVSVLVLFIGVNMLHKYYNQKTHLTYIFPVCYLIVAILSGWEVLDIVGSALLNVAFSTILLIFNTPQKQTK